MKHHLLREENIVAGLSALDHESALEKIIESLPDWSLRGIDKKKILKLLILREQIGTTAIGQGIALPHCFSPDVKEPIVAFGVSSEGIPYPSLDGKPVNFIFVLLLPQDEKSEQKKRQILQNIKWLLGDRYLQERLRAAQSAHEICQLLVPEQQPEFAFEVSGAR